MLTVKAMPAASASATTSRRESPSSGRMMAFPAFERRVAIPPTSALDSFVWSLPTPFVSWPARSCSDPWSPSSHSANTCGRPRRFTTSRAACIFTHHVAVLGPAFAYVFATALVYGVLWFAYRPRLGFYNRFGDYSYGVYLWGFPMEQLVVHIHGRPTSPPACFWSGLLLTVLCAVASWHLVEKPALRWKG